MRALSEPFPPPPFAGFSPAAFAFLRGLAERQDKTWFAARKAEYEAELRAPMEALVAALSERLAAKGLPFRGDPRRSMFRIHRDTRFSADKRPFKAHVSAAITRDGGKASPGVLYVHVDPAGSFTAAGFFRPEPQALNRMRAALVRDPAGWRKTVRALDRHGLALGRDDALVRPPRGFDGAPDEAADDLKLKSWIVRRPVAEAAAADAGLIDGIVAFARAAEPLLSFGWRALDG